MAILCHKCLIITCEGLLQKNVCISANILIWELLLPDLVKDPQICQAVISTVTVFKVVGVGNAYCVQDFLFKVLQLLLFNIPFACFIHPFSGASLCRFFLSCTVVYLVARHVLLRHVFVCWCCYCCLRVLLTCCVLWAIWLVGSFSCRLIK